jgi:hypothetical protein
VGVNGLGNERNGSLADPRIAMSKENSGQRTIDLSENCEEDDKYVLQKVTDIISNLTIRRG